MKAEADVSSALFEKTFTRHSFSPVLEVCLVRGDGAVSLVGVRPRQLLQRLTVEPECEQGAAEEDSQENPRDVGKKRHETDEGCPVAEDTDSRQVDDNAQVQETTATVRDCGHQDKGIPSYSSRDKDRDAGLAPGSGADCLSPPSEKGDDHNGVPRPASYGEEGHAGALGVRVEAPMTVTSTPSPTPGRHGESEDRTAKAVSQSATPETHTPERRGRAERQQKVTEGADEETAGSPAVPSEREDQDSKDRGKKRRGKRSRRVSTPLRRFVEMQAEEASEDGEEGGNLFDDATVVGGVEEATGRRGRGSRRVLKADGRTRRKRRRKGERGDARGGKKRSGETKEFFTSVSKCKKPVEPGQNSRWHIRKVLFQRAHDLAQVHVGRHRTSMRAGSSLGLTLLETFGLVFLVSRRKEEMCRVPLAE